MSPQEKYAEKIALLLRKAESTTPEEAELLVAKAQALMTKYAVHQALVDAARGHDADEIEQRTLVFVGGFRNELRQLALAVAYANGCKGVTRDSGSWGGSREVDGRAYREWVELTLTGFRSDLDRVELLSASLQVQAVSAVGTWYKSAGHEWWTRGERYRYRRDFLEGFASGARKLLRETARVAQDEGVAEHAAETGQTVESTALVLRARADRVQDWFDKRYGNSLTAGRATYRRVSGSSYGAGKVAGSRADVGRSRLGAQRSLGRSS